MGAALRRDLPEFAATVAQCLALLPPEVSGPLERLAFSGDTTATPDHEAALTQTSVAQPGLFIIEDGLAQQYKPYGIEPQAVVGHIFVVVVWAVLVGLKMLLYAMLLG